MPLATARASESSSGSTSAVGAGGEDGPADGSDCDPLATQVRGVFGPSLMMMVSGFWTTTRPVASIASTTSCSACLGVSFLGLSSVAPSPDLGTAASITTFLHSVAVIQAAKSVIEVSGRNCRTMLALAGGALHSGASPDPATAIEAQHDTTRTTRRRNM